jgi:hypothetical protein
MEEAMSKKKKLLLSVIIIIAVISSYFYIPLSADKIFPEVEQIEKIYLGHARGETGDTFNYEEVPIEGVANLKQFLNIISKVEYVRTAKKDILNPDRFYSFTVMYTNQAGDRNNYLFQVNEKGYVKVYPNGIQTYKISNGDGKKVFKQLERFVHDSEISKAKPITYTPFTKKSEFTYLEELADDKIEKYNQFLEDGYLHHLTEFKPEEIVLVFMNLVFNHHVERIYALTYNNGQLPTPEIFKDEYSRYLANLLEQDYLRFRFYDSINVAEGTSRKEDITVQLNIQFGTITHILAYGLKKEENIWKMDIYPWLEKLKSERDSEG